MKIVKLEVKNMKKLKAVRIEPDGNLVVIGGQNAEGKTSVLDSIMYILKDKSSRPSQPVREGESKASGILDLGDLLAKRTITATGGGSLKVTSKSGKDYPGGTPQAILDELMGKVSFDPLEFSRMKPAAQADVLRDLVGLDTAKLDARRKGLYDSRTDANRGLKQLYARLSALPAVPADVPAEEVSVSELAKNLEEISKRNLVRDKGAHGLVMAEKAISDLKEILQRAQDAVFDAEGDYAELEKETERRLADLPGGADHEPTEPITEAMEQAEGTNRQVRAKQNRDNLKAEIENAEAETYCLTEDIESLDAEKAAMLSDVEFPIEGLGIDDAGVSFNGVPFNQASSAEQLRVSVAIGIASNPVLKVLRVYDGSLLDESGLKILGQMAEEADAQVWIERVGVGDEMSVVIEDGEVVS